MWHHGFNLAYFFFFNHHTLAGKTRAGPEGEGQEEEEIASPDLPRVKKIHNWAKPFEKFVFLAHHAWNTRESIPKVLLNHIHVLRIYFGREACSKMFCYCRGRMRIWCPSYSHRRPLGKLCCPPWWAETPPMTFQQILCILAKDMQSHKVTFVRITSMAALRGWWGRLCTAWLCTVWPLLSSSVVTALFPLTSVLLLPWKFI